MYNACFTITPWKGIKTDFHKKYSVFDGLGSFQFLTLLEARQFVRSRSLLLKKTYKQALKIYEVLSSYHVKKVARFRQSYLQNSCVCEALTTCLWHIEKLSSPHYPVYRLSNLKKLLDKLLYISNLLNKILLSSRIVQLINNFFIDYPEYKSTNCKSNNKQIKNEKKCSKRSQKSA